MSSLVHQKLALAPPLAPILGKRAPPDPDLRSAAAAAPPGVRTSSVTAVHLGQKQPSMFPDGFLVGIEEPDAAKDDEDEKDDVDDDAGSQMSGTSVFRGTRDEFDELISELEGASPASPVSAGSRMSPTSPLPWTSNLAPVDTTPWHQLEGYMSFPLSA